MLTLGLPKVLKLSPVRQHSFKCVFFLFFSPLLPGDEEKWLRRRGKEGISPPCVPAAHVIQGCQTVSSQAVCQLHHIKQHCSQWGSNKPKLLSYPDHNHFSLLLLLLPPLFSLHIRLLTLGFFFRQCNVWVQLSQYAITKHVIKLLNWKSRVSDCYLPKNPEFGVIRLNRPNHDHSRNNWET